MSSFFHSIGVLLGGEVLQGRALQQKHTSRPSEVENLIFFEYITNFHLNNYEPRPNALPRIPIYRPLYDTDLFHEDDEDLCRVKLLLHHPFRRETDLYMVDTHLFTIFKDAYHAYRLSNHNHPEDSYSAGLEPTVVDEFIDQAIPEDVLDQPWDPLVLFLPANETEDAIPGFRSFDRQFDLIGENIWILIISSLHIGKISKNNILKRLLTRLTFRLMQEIFLTGNNFRYLMPSS